MFSGDNLLLNCKMVPNAPTTSPDAYSQCGYTKAISDTCKETPLQLLLLFGSTVWSTCSKDNFKRGCTYDFIRFTWYRYSSEKLKTVQSAKLAVTARRNQHLETVL